MGGLRWVALSDVSGSRWMMRAYQCLWLHASPLSCLFIPDHCIAWCMVHGHEYPYSWTKEWPSDTKLLSRRPLLPRYLGLTSRPHPWGLSGLSIWHLSLISHLCIRHRIIKSSNRRIDVRYRVRPPHSNPLQVRGSTGPGQYPISTIQFSIFKLSILMHTRQASASIQIQVDELTTASSIQHRSIALLAPDPPVTTNDQ